MKFIWRWDEDPGFTVAYRWIHKNSIPHFYPLASLIKMNTEK